MLFRLEARTWVMTPLVKSSLRARSPGVPEATVQPASPGRAFPNAWAKRKGKWAKQVWLIGKKKSRRENSQFFLKIGLAWLSLAQGAPASHARLSPVSLSVFTHSSDLTARACLNSQKIRTVLQSRKSQSVNQSINQYDGIYLYLTLLILAESLQQQQVWQKRFVYLGVVIGNLDWIGS